MDTWIDNFYRFLNSLGFPDPVHAALVHLPMGLILGAFVFSLLSVFSVWKRPAVTAHHCITLAVISLFPVIVFGFMDWRHFYLGGWLMPIKIKMILAFVLLILSFLAFLSGFSAGEESKLMLFLYTLCVIIVIGLGWFGSRVVNGETVQAHSKQHPVGEKIFIANCRVCHSDGGNKFETEHPLRKSEALQKFDYFLAQIRTPDEPMPSFTTAQIPDKEAGELYQYVVKEFGCP